ncbi:hypothetical protein Q7L71_03615 [Conexibacter sp. CPCC 205706]|uniref:VirB4 family type IV secretion system protein n=1 Tax=unclassified Conexibacter TaxID=2627773 RepID=UPI0027159BFF|nr:MULTISPECIES: hypothetical protein [unclassified Conexibacter]MDO8184650.1 hypothetical protein [Conexibacter sp. CPCC 205706]MDO8197956.1 hypothetical protein [Conexibacter sp. CPCC 205762]
MVDAAARGRRADRPVARAGGRDPARRLHRHALGRRTGDLVADGRVGTDRAGRARPRRDPPHRASPLRPGRRQTGVTPDRRGARRIELSGRQPVTAVVLGARRRAAQVGDLLPLVGFDGEQRALLEDGTVVSAFAVQPLDPLVLDEERVGQLAGQVHKLLARVPAGQQLSLYVDSDRLDVDELNSDQNASADRVAREITKEGRPELAAATRLFAHAQADTLRQHTAASRLRYYVVCPTKPERASRPRRDRRGSIARIAPDALAATVAEHERYIAAVLAGLQAMRLGVRQLSAADLVHLLRERCSPSAPSTGQRPTDTGLLAPIDTVERADEATIALKTAICDEQLDARGRSHLSWERCVERVVRLGSVPDETWLGWTQYLTLATLPFTLAVHFHGRDRFRERSRQKRRYKQIWASNRGQERLGKLVDPDREDAEAEAREVTATLKRQAASTVYDVCVYLAMREPGGDLARLADELRMTCRELTAATDAVVNECPFAQLPLWRATLPLGIDEPRRGRRYLSLNAADTWPLIGAGSGSPPSPTAMPLGLAQPGRELVWMDPFDSDHPNHVTVVSGQSGGGKTMAVNLLVGRALAKGATGAVIDRSGHWDFLVETVPGAAAVRIGGGVGEHRLNAWDGPPTSAKVAFLVALHELILTDADSSVSSLGALEESLLGLSIRSVYRRCAISCETPRETLLQEELLRRQRQAQADGAHELAGTLRLLAESLHNYVGDGPYAWLCDHETTVDVDAPLTVYDTRTLPDSEAPAAMFVICEAIVRRIEEERERFLATDHAEAPLPWAGKAFLVFEEVWKLVKRASTGRWVNELARRSRHLALWLVAISQQLGDFDGPQAEALISQSSIRLVVRQSAGQLDRLAERLGLAPAAVELLRELQTVKRHYSQIYVQNGSRGEGVVTVMPGAWEYWRATSDPVGDEPMRRQALRDVGGHGWARAWRALELLADPARRDRREAQL